MQLRDFIPDFIKPILRLIRYPQERRKVIREITVRSIQDQRILKKDANATKLIIFLIEGADYQTGKDRISGGIMSIVSLCEETARLGEMHGSEVILCTFPEQHLLNEHTQFRNQTSVFRYNQLDRYFSHVQEVLVHIPEYLTNYFYKMLLAGKFNWLQKREYFRLNILNQNIQLMPTPDEVGLLKKLSNKITITSAHEQYCTREMQQRYQVPLHKFSVWISPEKYQFRSFKVKRDFLVVSPDSHPGKDDILTQLSKLPNLKIQIIQNLTYEQYKDVISYAKWTLTFGEGLDGYLIEPIFSGAIGFAVYNEEFFTEDFRGLQGIYPSYTEMAIKLADDIMYLNSESTYTETQSKQFELCSKYYSYDQYRDNIAQFYLENYTYR